MVFGPSLLFVVLFPAVMCRAMVAGKRRSAAQKERGTSVATEVSNTDETSNRCFGPVEDHREQVECSPSLLIC
jgi:hypothetical protein